MYDLKITNPWINSSKILMKEKKLQKKFKN